MEIETRKEELSSSELEYQEVKLMESLMEGPEDPQICFKDRNQNELADSMLEELEERKDWEYIAPSNHKANMMPMERLLEEDNGFEEPCYEGGLFEEDYGYKAWDQRIGREFVGDLGNFDSEYEEGMRLMEKLLTVPSLPDDSHSEEEIEEQILVNNLPALRYDDPHPLEDDEDEDFFQQNSQSRMNWSDSVLTWDNKWIIPFTSSIGPFGFDLSQTKRPNEFFSLMFDDKVIELIVAQTNIKAAEFFERYPEAKKKKYYQDWLPVDKVELRAFLAIVMYMGIVRLPSMTDHWENGVVLRPTAVSQIMPRDRFYVLFQFLHLNEDKYDFKTDKIYKIRRLILTLLPNFKKYYQIDEHISIDEKMIKFTGRSCMKQYIKQKASKWGFKAFILAEARSGYVYDWILYEGKQGPTPKKNLAANIVTQLVRGLENKGHRLYTDNYYTSVDLALSLMDKQIGLTGTIRSNRKKLPKEVLKKKTLKEDRYLQQGVEIFYL